MNSIVSLDSSGELSFGSSFLFSSPLKIKPDGEAECGVADERRIGKKWATYLFATSFFFTLPLPLASVRQVALELLTISFQLLFFLVILCSLHWNLRLSGDSRRAHSGSSDSSDSSGSRTSGL